uniref:Uncharacterized protein n=1 Tax=Arundo donax TaxID=35708 RepID=A0A0A9BNX3_ARUDO
MGAREMGMAGRKVDRLAAVRQVSRGLGGPDEFCRLCVRWAKIHLNRTTELN